MMLPLSKNPPIDPTAKPEIDYPSKLLSVAGIDSSSSLIDIDKTLEQLTKAGASLEQSLNESQRRIESLAIPQNRETAQSNTSLDSDKRDSQQIAEFKSHDVLLPDYIDQWTRQLSQQLGSRVALYIANSRGKIQESKTIGWDSAIFRMNKTCAEQVVRNCILQSQTLLSVNCSSTDFVAEKNRSTTEIARDVSAAPCSDISAREEPHPPKISFCVNLNRLSNATGTPLIATAWKLDKSSSYAVLIVDAGTSVADRCTRIATESFLPTMPQSCAMAHELDAWYLLRRCNWAIRWMQRSEWLKTNPSYVIYPLALLILGAFCPVPYYPRRECVIEPEAKQYVSSPIAGRISKCFVRPGDRVEKNQLLANLDDEDIRRELATAEAEYEGAQKKFNAALAQKSSGERGIAKIEIQKAETKIESLREQLHRLEVRSISSGIVVQGDWHKNVGSPVTLGQNLFEIAELDSMTAEIHLTPLDLGYINIGDRVAVRSAASGGHTFQGKIRRIEPRAKVENNESFFIADVDIRDPDVELRPGMKAQAQITAGWKSVGWLLFSRPYRWLANQWIW